MSKRLFISHSWSYSERYNSMVDLLDNRNYFTWTNYSVPVDKAFESMTKAALQEQLRKQIRPVNCAIIIGGMWANHSDWIKFELDFAVSIGKPILGVRPRGAQLMPMAITEVANKAVNWNSDSIVAGIREIS
ncbi:TIR domain-containing protein [Hoeflea sp. AS60]|uniref:TIR domain-containing protein n=1 Tax=Hoeflea sp. AS60 TaxID=3135780 RepID=UPI003173E473